MDIVLLLFYEVQVLSLTKQEGDDIEEEEEERRTRTTRESGEKDKSAKEEEEERVEEHEGEDKDKTSKVDEGKPVGDKWSWSTPQLPVNITQLSVYLLGRGRPGPNVQDSGALAQPAVGVGVKGGGGGRADRSTVLRPVQGANALGAGIFM